jgi:hypothetical protein
MALQGRAFALHDALAGALARLESGFPIKPVRAFVVDLPALSAQQHVDTSIAVAALGQSNLADTFSKPFGFVSSGSIGEQ